MRRSADRSPSEVDNPREPMAYLGNIAYKFLNHIMDHYIIEAMFLNETINWAPWDCACTALSNSSRLALLSMRGWSQAKALFASVNLRIQGEAVNHHSPMASGLCANFEIGRVISSFRNLVPGQHLTFISENTHHASPQN